MTAQDVKSLEEKKKDYTLVCIDKEAVCRIRINAKYRDGKYEYIMLDDCYNKELIDVFEFTEDNAIKAGDRSLLVVGYLNA